VFKRNRQAVILSESMVSVDFLRWLKIIVSLLVVGSLLAWSYIKINDPQTLPITKVRALGDFSFVTEEMLHKALSQGVKEKRSDNKKKNINKTAIDILENKGFFSIDVAAIKQRVETMPWVKRASVQRVWPDTLIIEVVEHKAVAYWGGKGLVSELGGIFYPDTQTYPKGLPTFIAAEGLVGNCLRYFNDASEMFAAIGLKVLKVKFSPRQALMLTLDNGVELNLGRQNKLYRLQRFTQVYSTLRGRMSLIERIDMRYTNGFSVKWKQREASGTLFHKVESGRANV